MMAKRKPSSREKASETRSAAARVTASASRQPRRTARGGTRRDAERRIRERPERAARGASRRSIEAPPRRGRPPRSTGNPEAPRKRPERSGPPTTPIRRPARPNSTSQAKARAKARKAKAPKAVRRPLKERLIAKLATIDLNPRTIAAKVPFVVLVIGSLGLGLAATLWLSTDSAERSYQLSNARDTNRVLSQQKEALERDVLEAQSAPALAEAARNLGMIPSRDTAHLVQDPAGKWVVVGEPKPAEGAPPPPLNNKLPDPTPPPPVNRTEVLVHLPAAPAPATGMAAAAGPEVLVRAPDPAAPAPAEQVAPAPQAADVPQPARPPAAPAPQAADAPQPANPPAAPLAGEQSNGVASAAAAPPT